VGYCAVPHRLQHGLQRPGTPHNMQ
jgi:hypothetical protein